MHWMRKMIVAFTVLISACSTYPSEEEEITWYFSLATPKHYDVWVEHLEFELSGVKHWWHPAGSMSCCWRGPSGPRGVFGYMEPFPNFVAIQWFSFAEQKFYQRLIEIPLEWKERMAEPAPMVTPKRVKMEPRDTLTFGLAPGGEIVIWMMNQVGNEIELARLQANEIEGNPSHYQNRTREYLEENREYLEEHGIPLTGW